MKHKYQHTTIELIEGDLTTMRVDAVVNAANGQLIHGGGVAGAIIKRGGPSIQEESSLWVKTRGPVPVGGVAITSAGRKGESREIKKLTQATLNALKMADTRFFQSIAFPAISTGIFGFPMDKCAKIMLTTVKSYVEGDTGIKKIVFCLYGEDAFSIFQKTFFKIFQ
jgi:O-acetyl-ADP-ribose deacetylase (regulator of RNase III)